MVSDEALVTGASPSKPVDVWDLPLRFVHWGLAAAVLTAYFSANVLDAVHETAGYTVLALVGFRLVWGFAGSRYSRFRSIISSLRVVFRYAAQLLRGQHHRYLGLNPAGAAMAVALLALLLVCSISGWMQITERFFGIDWVEQVHRCSSDLVLLLVIVHVAGVLAMSLLQRENLVRAMITGRKRDDPAD